MDNEKLTPEQESKIDEAYDKMLDAATIKANEEGKLTNEQVNQLAERLQDVVESDPVLSAIADAPSNNGVKITPAPAAVPEDAETKEVVVSIDPETGANNIIGPTMDDDIDPDFDLSQYLNMESYEADHIDLSNLELSESIKKEYDLSNEDAVQLVKLLMRVQNKEKDIRYYDELPKGCKKYAETMALASGSMNRAMLNTTAKSLVDMIFNEVAADVFQIDVENLINTEIKKSGVDLSTVYSDMVLGKKVKLYEAADKIEADGPEKKNNAQILREIGDSCEESYMMTDFINAIEHHKIKIRKIDVEKPDKVFRDFNMKYESSKLGINCVSDLTYCIPRHLATATIKPNPDTVTSKTVIAFVVAFCNYCRNYDPANVVQHTFMYYFIKNILHLDAVPPGAEPSQFAQDLIDRIESTLETLHRVYGY